jgi:hypothetical protein
VILQRGEHVAARSLEPLGLRGAVQVLLVVLEPAAQRLVVDLRVLGAPTGGIHLAGVAPGVLVVGRPDELLAVCRP